MKRYLTILFAIVMALAVCCLSACNEEQTSNTATTVADTTVSVTTDSSETTMLTTDAVTTGAVETTTASTEAPEEPFFGVADVTSLYATAMNKIQFLHGLDFDMTQTTWVFVNGFQTEVPMTFSYQIADLDTDNPEMRMIMITKAMGIEFAMDVYVKDGWCYYTSEEGNYKEQIPENDPDFDMTDIKDIFGNEEIPADLLKDVFVYVLDGMTTWEMNFSGEQLLTYFGTLTSFVMQDDLLPETIEGATMSFTVNEEGYLVALSLGMTVLECDEETGVEISTSAEFYLNINDPGQPVTVEAPEGYENYEEYDFDGDDEFGDDLTGEETTKAETTAPSTPAVDVYDVYVNAVNKTDALTSIDATISMNMSMVAEGMTMEVPGTIRMQAAMTEEGGLVMRMIMSTTTMGMDVVEDIFVKDGYVYYTFEEGNYKISMEEYGDIFDLGSMESSEILPEALLNLATVEETEEGTIITFTLDGETFYTYFADFVDDLMSDGATVSTDDLSGITVSYTVNADGYISAFSISCTMTTSMEDMGSWTTTLSMSVTYNNPGQEVVIEGPEGYESYPDYEDFFEDYYGDDFDYEGDEF